MQYVAGHLHIDKGSDPFYPFINIRVIRKIGHNIWNIQLLDLMNLRGSTFFSYEHNLWNTQYLAIHIAFARLHYTLSSHQ